MTMPVLTPRAAREQRTFRALLDAMARPGSVLQLPDCQGGSPLLLVAEALVDHEVTFAAPPDGQEPTDAILRQTGSRIDSLEYADYVFCTPEGLTETIQRCKEGIPECPDASATVVCEVPAIAETGGADDGIVLSGPGIRDEARLLVAGVDREAWSALAEKNSAPPLGVDLVLVAPSGRVICLSRYTKLQVKE